MPIDQSTIIDKFKSFLALQKRQLRVSRGYCNGFSLLWLYYKSIGKDELFFRALYEISEWKETNTNPQILNTIENIFNDVIWFQLQHHLLPNLDQTNLPAALDAVRNNKNTATPAVEKEFSFSFTLSRQEIIALLKKITHENKMVHLSSGSHAMGLMLQNGIYDFYDCNCDGKNSFNTLEDVVDEFISIFNYQESSKGKAGYYGISVCIYDHANRPKKEYFNINNYIKELLAQRGKIDQQDVYGFSSLALASQNDNKEICRNLLRRGAALNLRDINGNTELHTACYNGHIEIVQLLLEYGANLRSRGKHLKSVLHFAVGSRNLTLIKFLLNQGADVNATDCKGHTPLHIAARLGYTEVLEELIKHGANIDTTDLKQRTPLFIAAQYDNATSANYLISHGAKLTWLNEYDESLLFKSIEGNYTAASQFFISKGVDVNVYNSALDTALHLAVKNDDVTSLRDMLSSYKNINQKNISGHSILHLAAIFGHKDCLLEILKYKPNPFSLDDTGFTALNLARQRRAQGDTLRFDEIVFLLENYQQNYSLQTLSNNTNSLFTSVACKTPRLSTTQAHHLHTQTVCS